MLLLLWLVTTWYVRLDTTTQRWHRLCASSAPHQRDFETDKLWSNSPSLVLYNEEFCQWAMWNRMPNRRFILFMQSKRISDRFRSGNLCVYTKRVCDKGYLYKHTCMYVCLSVLARTNMLYKDILYVRMLLERRAPFLRFPQVLHIHVIWYIFICDYLRIVTFSSFQWLPQ